MTSKMAQLKPELDKLQKKYANNPQKLSEEQMKLYKKVGYNPLGCIGSLLPQLIILSVLIGVIRAVTSNDVTGLYPFVMDWVSNGTGVFNINTGFLGLDMTQAYSSLKETLGVTFFDVQVLPYLVLAVVVGIVQFVTTKLTTILQNPDSVNKKKKKKKGGLLKLDDKGEPDMTSMQDSMQGSMLLMFPIMTIFVSISAPAALGIYWIIQSLMVLAQYFILDFDKSKKGVQNLWTVFKSKLNKK